ncbi:thiamine-phosphate kinase [Lichenicola cladoniae]|uniref:Thiamine-monophosphate kinase n=1 Tax=Lichenicola cladoniae TaxID=1484109 RepID=A0A6M8HNG2_9PROT|nr:thiamine-phosphate kinase [Lichenicola cladoniae]NPD67417.1 thiamine-phosphate kinase [Acetobacteraceae bacterium]QKE89908.1 thiamine-phosphate kinase [Lichenicola cladoniae]
MTEPAAEFAFIARHFRPLAGPGGLALSDDAAVFLPPAGRELVMCADAMVSGVHFLAADPPDTVARKLLRVNLSDLAAMGAEPLGYLMTVSVPPDLPPNWFEGFGAGLAIDQAQYGLSLFGGDTTSTTGPLVLSLTIVGHVAPGAALRRNGAQAGDGIWVTGTIGDGTLGLACLTGELDDDTGQLADRYRLPQPRMGMKLAGVAHAAIDVSDGLVQDLGHLCRESGVAARIEAALVPASEAARQAGPAWLERRLSGGDDYELLLAVPPGAEATLLAEAGAACIRVTRIGMFEAGLDAVHVIAPDGTALIFERPGWSHFPG